MTSFPIWPANGVETSEDYGAGPEGKPVEALAPSRIRRHACVAMDCDDCILLMAHPSHESAEFSAHLASCESCSQLAEDLRGDDSSPREDGGADDDLIGTVIGAYEISELIGSGGMGRVYMARHPTIGSRVAIKVFSKDWNEHPTLVSRFFAEAHATNVIAHENIVNVLDVGRLEDGRPYLIMEFLLGAPLSKLVGTEILNDSALTQIVLDVLSALSAAHENQIVHRDLKPDNIFVSPEGRATLLDFGIAKLMPEIGVDSAPTATGTVLGTPHYMSPEQAVGDPVDTRTDVYAMGIILYECFTGRRPFTGGSLYRLMDQHVNRKPTPPRAIRPDLGGDVEAVILKALAKSPADRFASTGEMRDALEACECSPASGAFTMATHPRSEPTDLEAETAATVANRPAPAPPTPAPSPPTPAPSPPKARMLWVAPALLVAGLLVGGGLWANRGSDSRVPSALEADAALSAQIVETQTKHSTPDASAPVAWDAASESAPDGAPVEVASSKDPRPRPPRARKVVGTAPLSLLDAATRAAHGNQPDAILRAVRVQGLNRQGRVLLGGANNEVSFDFLSPKMANRIIGRGRERGVCVVRVTYRDVGKADVTQVGSTCIEVRMLPRPSCTISRILEKAAQSGAVPSEGTLTGASLQNSKNKREARAFWKFMVDGRGYNAPSC